MMLTGLVRAAAPAPSVEALMSPDGDYVLEVRPSQQWHAAEVSVRGGGAENVGAQAQDAVLLVEGSVSSPGLMWVTVNAALDDDHGASWVFGVEPQVVPINSPRLTRLQQDGRRRCRWFWWASR